MAFLPMKKKVKRMTMKKNSGKPSCQIVPYCIVEAPWLISAPSDVLGS
mgnify:CR=1 FL=1